MRSPETLGELAFQNFDGLKRGKKKSRVTSCCYSYNDDEAYIESNIFDWNSVEASMAFPVS
jgi:hypothetical protein